MDARLPPLPFNVDKTMSAESSTGKAIEIEATTVPSPLFPLIEFPDVELNDNYAEFRIGMVMAHVFSPFGMHF